MRFSPSFTTLLASTCLAFGCAEDPLSKVLPLLSVEPEALDFGDGCVGADNTLPLVIRNRGDGVLDVDRVFIDPETAPFSVREVPERVTPRAERELGVVFVPRVAREAYAADLVIVSSDPARPELRVPLVGVGGVRNIVVTPLEVDFGTVNEGTSPRRAVEIRNIGGDPLDVSSIVFTSTSADLRLAPRTFIRGIVPAKTATVVELIYSPVDLGADSGLLIITSDDDDEPRIEIPVRGRANLAPRAIAWGCDKSGAQIGCDGRSKLRTLSAGLFRLVGLDGRESSDPEGGAVSSYRWAIVSRPNASRAVVFHSTEDRQTRKNATGDLEVDRVGRYDLRLIVRDDRGLESLDREESHVFILPKDLEVVLRWDVGTDVDLHLVRPGGRAGDYGNGRVGTSTGSDCATFNRQPNWSDLGTNLDDPKLDKDDVSGSGPEIVSLDAPDPSGAYGAYAHYCDSQNRRVNVHATFEVFVRGELVATVPDDGLGYRLIPGELWEGARITWDVASETAQVVETGALPQMRPELCITQ